MISRKRIWWQILATLLIASLALTACAKATEQVTEEPKVEEPEPVLIAFGFNGPTSDEGWTWVADQARQAVEAAYGDRVRTVYAENVPYSEEGSRIFEQFVADGAAMIFENTGYGEVFQNVVAEHPDVAFLGINIPMHENEMGYYIQHQYTAYLIGMAAGLMTETDKIGYVCSFAGFNQDVNAFHMGARSVNPDVATHVGCINSWFDPAAARQASEALIDYGVDFLFGIMDEPAFLVVADERGVWAATWNTDNERFAPEAYVTSSVIDWEDFYVEQVGKLLDGTWVGGEMVLLELGEGNYLDDWGKNVPQDVRDQVDAMRDRMMNEGYNPFVGPIRDTGGNVVIAEGEEMTPMYVYGEWYWVVEGIVGLD